MTELDKFDLINLDNASDDLISTVEMKDLSPFQSKQNDIFEFKENGLTDYNLLHDNSPLQMLHSSPMITEPKKRKSDIAFDFSDEPVNKKRRVSKTPVKQNTEQLEKENLSKFNFSSSCLFNESKTLGNTKKPTRTSRLVKPRPNQSKWSLSPMIRTHKLKPRPLSSQSSRINVLANEKLSPFKIPTNSAKKPTTPKIKVRRLSGSDNSTQRRLQSFPIISPYSKKTVFVAPSSKQYKRQILERRKRGSVSKIPRPSPSSGLRGNSFR